MTDTYIGTPVLRKEDPELVTGQANYIDNWTMPGMVWMALVRPPYVHATIDAIDTAEAAAMPGVVGVYTADDLGLGALPFVWPISEDI
jgi:carbon-monoxide dehydrogenase large subunit